MPRILLIDESSAYCTGLGCLIKKNIRHAEVLEAISLPKAFSQIREGKFIDLVMVDLALSRVHSVEKLRQASGASPVTRWAVMAGAETRTDILTTLAAGFYGFVSKHQSDGRILSGIKDMLSGRIHVPMSLATTKEMSPDDDGRYVISSSANILRLTARQREVLSLITQGLSNKEIGSALHITEATTKIHTATLLRTLGVRNRTEAAFKAATLIDIINKLDLRMDDIQTSPHDDTQIRKLRPINGG